MNATTTPSDAHAPAPAHADESAVIRALPVWLRPLHRHAARTISRLPSAPPSWVAARALNIGLWPRLPAEVHEALAGRVVSLEVTDLGWRVRLRGSPHGFILAGDAVTHDLRIAAHAQGWWRLARGEDDPDRLFFDRILLMEGDTELGLILKNTLDALGPLWPAPSR